MCAEIFGRREIYTTYILHSCSILWNFVRKWHGETEKEPRSCSSEYVLCVCVCSGASFGHVQCTVRDTETMRQTSNGSSRKEAAMWTKATDYT